MYHLFWKTLQKSIPVLLLVFIEHWGWHIGGAPFVKCWGYNKDQKALAATPQGLLSWGSWLTVG